MSSGKEPVLEQGRQLKRNESSAPSHPTLSSSVLSSLNGNPSIISGNPQRRDGEEQKKKSKKHKHDKDKSRHTSSSRKKRRHGNSIVKSSKIAIASAENALRHSQDVRNNSQGANDSSSSQLGVTEEASRSIFNSKSSTGYDFPISVQFLQQSHPFPTTEIAGTGPGSSDGVRGDAGGGGGSVFSAMMIPGSGMSARNAAHHALFASSGYSSSSHTAVAPHQTNMLHGSVPYSLLTEDQFRLHNEANRSAAHDALRNRLSTDGEMLQQKSNSNSVSHTLAVASSSSEENITVSAISKESAGPRICAQNTVTNIDIKDLRALFHFSLVEASKQLGMCTTLFKKICRRNNIEKWPYRKIHSLMNKVESLEHYLQDNEAKIPESVKLSYKDQISSIMKKVNDIKENTGVASMKSTRIDSLPLSEESTSGSTCSGNDMEKRNQGKSVGTEGASESGSDGGEGTRKRRRYETSYDFKTGWVANCSTCGKVGKYRHPSQGRVFQHSSGTGKYCGYFRDNPRQEGGGMGIPGNCTNAKATLASSVPPSINVPESAGSNSSV